MLVIHLTITGIGGSIALAMPDSVVVASLVSPAMPPHLVSGYEMLA